MIQENSTDLNIGLSIAEPMPYFCLPGIDKKLYTNSSFQDALCIAICFTSNHCPYAIGYEERLLELWDRYKSSGLQMIFVMSNDGASYPEDSFEKMQDKDYPFPYLHDSNQSTARAFGAEATPEIFIFDKTQTLRYHGGIDDSPKDKKLVTKAYANDAIKAILTGNKIETEEAPFIGCSIKWNL